jgi:hypothetical protein
MDDVHLPPSGGAAAGVHEEPYLDEQMFDFLHPHGVEFVDPLPPPSGVVAGGVVVEEFVDPLPPPGGVGVDDDFEFDLKDIDLDIVLTLFIPNYLMVVLILVIWTLISQVVVLLLVVSLSLLKKLSRNKHSLMKIVDVFYFHFDV